MVTVLVPVDGSTQAEDAVRYSTELFPAASLTLLYVLDPIGRGPDTDKPDALSTWIEAQQEKADRVLAETRELVEDDRPVSTETRAGTPWREIVEFADENEVDHIVMGSHGRDGAKRLLLGSVAELVVRRASMPVTVVND